MRVHVEQHVAQRVGVDGEEPARPRRSSATPTSSASSLSTLARRCADSSGLSLKLKTKSGVTASSPSNFLMPRSAQLLRDERGVEVAEGRVVPGDEEPARAACPLVHRAVDEDARLEAEVLAELAERDERGRQLDERGRVEGHVRVVLGEDVARRRATRTSTPCVSGSSPRADVPRGHVEGGLGGRQLGAAVLVGGCAVRRRGCSGDGLCARVSWQRVGREGQREDDGDADRRATRRLAYEDSKPSLSTSLSTIISFANRARKL